MRHLSSAAAVSLIGFIAIAGLDSPLFAQSNCTPDCEGRQCGGDGCGGACGECPTGESCTEGGRCLSADACRTNENCNDDDPCTEDFCRSDGSCGHEEISGCCRSHDDCHDDDPCTEDFCRENHTCGHEEIPDCQPECHCNDDCDENQVCREGRCSPACVADCLPGNSVCGSDGRTYPCGGDAECHGVDTLFEGPCPPTCEINDDCDEGSICDAVECPTDCGCPNFCQDCICPAIFAPVCGVDGLTYGNECEALCAHVEVEHEGPCEPECLCNEDCDDGRVCREGECGPICDALCLPGHTVCGADGQTYPCEGSAFCNGVEVLFEGACPPTCEIDEDCDAGSICESVECPNDCGCPEFCTDCVCPDVYAPVCGVDGLTYGNECEALCAHVEVEHEGPCEPECLCNEDCDDGLVCRDGHCAAPCNLVCIVADPVCGADGVTYYCGEGDAACHGVGVIANGECPPTCRHDDDCVDGGACVPFPECTDACGCPGICESCVCPEIYDPVCGTDGHTYSNECFARCAHVDVDHEGECENQACRDGNECDDGLVCTIDRCDPETGECAHEQSNNFFCQISQILSGGPGSGCAPLTAPIMIPAFTLFFVTSKRRYRGRAQRR